MNHQLLKIMKTKHIVIIPNIHFDHWFLKADNLNKLGIKTEDLYVDIGYDKIEKDLKSIGQHYSQINVYDLSLGIKYMISYDIL